MFLICVSIETASLTCRHVRIMGVALINPTHKLKFEARRFRYEKQDLRDSAKMVVFHTDTLGLVTFSCVYLLIIYADYTLVYQVIEYGKEPRYVRCEF